MVRNTKNKDNAIKYIIFDLTGRMINSGNTKFMDKIYIENLTNGNYLIQLENEFGEKITKKLIKN